MHAIQLLDQGLPDSIGPLVVLSGTERFLKQAVLTAVADRILGDDQVSLGRYAGADVSWVDLRDDLFTVSMFGDQRLVLVDDADDFVKAHRGQLEEFVASPPSAGVLVLDVKSFPSNTKLARAVAKTGLSVDCGELKGGRLVSWVRRQSRERYRVELTSDAASLLVQLAGSSLGLLDQQLAKLATCGDDRPVEADQVRSLVGGWRVETTFAMLAALRDGHTGRALEHLERLFRDGEHPLKVLGGITFVYRRLARATETARQGTGLKTALTRAGVFPRDIGPSNQYLRRIGRLQAERFYRQLLETDLGLKTRRSGRTAQYRLDWAWIERLLVGLSGRV